MPSCEIDGPCSSSAASESHIAVVVVVVTVLDCVPWSGRGRGRAGKET